MHPRALLRCTAAALLMAACSSIAPHVKEEHMPQQHYLKYAAVPVDHCTYRGRFDNWRPLGDCQIVVWTYLDEAYPLSVREPCADLPFANGIGVSSTAGAVNRARDACSPAMSAVGSRRSAPSIAAKCALLCAPRQYEERFT
jgi:Family of unknown function (DUF6491)